MQRTHGSLSITKLTTRRSQQHTSCTTIWGQITYLNELRLRTESADAYDALTRRIERIKFLSSGEQKENN